MFGTARLCLKPTDVPGWPCYLKHGHDGDCCPPAPEERA